MCRTSFLPSHSFCGVPQDPCFCFHSFQSADLLFVVGERGCHEILVSVLTLLFSSVLSFPNSRGFLHYLPESGFQFSSLCMISNSRLSLTLIGLLRHLLRGPEHDQSSGMFCVYFMGKGAIVMNVCQSGCRSPVLLAQSQRDSVADSEGKVYNCVLLQALSSCFESTFRDVNDRSCLLD